MKRRYYNPYTNSNDKAKILAAMQKDPTIIQHVSEKMKRDRAFIFEALQQGDLCGDVGWTVLRHVPRDAVNIRGDREIVEMAVRRSCGGMALEFAVDELTGDRELVMLAIGMGPRTSDHQGSLGSFFFVRLPSCRRTVTWCWKLSESMDQHWHMHPRPCGAIERW